MALYIGKIGDQWVHTYSKDLRDEFIPNNYVVVYTLGTGRNGGTKIRGFPKNSKPLSEIKRTGIVTDNLRWNDKEAIKEQVEGMVTK